MASFWAPTNYGYSPIYWVTVSGVPVLFAERALGLTMPTGIGIEDGSLVIDDSAEVGVEHIDRDRGIGVGLDFGLKLLDTSTVRDWLRKWSKSCTLTQDFLAGDATVNVDDTTGWDGIGILYIGLERIQYGSKPGTTFGTLSRATCGSLEADHKAGTTGQIVTDRPRHWRGREVTLWASMADPSGHVCGSAYVSQEAVQVWRGRITSSPERHTDGFAFSCQSIDRILDEQLAAKMSGDVTGTGAVYLLPTGWNVGVFMIGTDNAGLEVWKADVKFTPFAGMTATYKSSDEIRTLISSAWAQAVTDSGAPATTHFGDWTWVQKSGKWHARIQLLKDATVYWVNPWLFLDGKEFSQIPTAQFPGGMKSAYDMDLNYYVNDIPPFCPTDPAGNQLPTGVTIRLTEGDPADVPATGKVKIKSGDTSCVYTYAVKGTDEEDLHLEGLQPLDKQVPLPVGKFKDASAEVLLDDQGTFDELILDCLESSGTALRGTYDVLAQGAGYGLDDSVIQESTFTSKLATGAIGTLQGDITSAGSSFTDMFGGVLALFRLAVVARPVTSEANTPIRLQVVQTAQGTDYTTTITDDDLLSHQGDPVVSVKRADSPNLINITRQPGGQEADDHLIFNDFAAVEATGKREVQYRIDATDRDALRNAAVPAVAAHFAYDQTVQAIELLVHPSVLAEVGDAIWLTTTHPAVWTWSTTPGQVGYDGPGRVVGRKLNLKTGQATLTLLVDGSLNLFALSPAAEVTAYNNASNPAWIEVDLKYIDHFTNAINNAGAAVGVLHYQPGEVEGTGQKYNISAATSVGGFCRLTVSSQTGVFDLDTTKRSTLTLPLTANATTYQRLFAHTGDGSQWG